MKRRKPNGFWVKNPVYNTKIWCVVKHLPTGVLHLTYIVPNHAYGYSWQKDANIQFMGVKDKEEEMWITYHVHPCARVYQNHWSNHWLFRSDWDVAQELFLKKLNPIL